MALGGLLDATQVVVRGGGAGDDVHPVHEPAGGDEGAGARLHARAERVRDEVVDALVVTVGRGGRRRDRDGDGWNGVNLAVDDRRHLRVLGWQDGWLTTSPRPSMIRNRGGVVGTGGEVCLPKYSC